MRRPYPLRKTLILVALTCLLLLFLRLPSGFGSWFSIAASKVYDAEYNPLKDDPSLSGYLSFLRSTMLLSGLDNFALFNILAVFGILVTAITYLTLLRGRTRTISYGLCMCTLLPIALFFQLLQGYVLGLSLPLLILGASLLVDRERFSPSRSKAICILILFSLSFIWHSAFGGFFALMLSFLIFSKRTWLASSRTPMLILLISVYAADSIFLYDSKAKDALVRIFSGDLLTGVLDAFRYKGSIASGYAFSRSGFDLIWTRIYVGVLYVGYMIVGATAVLIPFRNFKKDSMSEHLVRFPVCRPQVVAALGLSAVVFIMVYYFAAGILAPLMIIACLMPVAFLALVDCRFFTGRVAKIAAFLVGLLVCVGIANAYQTSESLPEWNISSEGAELQEVSHWVLWMNSPENTQVLSDAFTMGNMIWVDSRDGLMTAGDRSSGLIGSVNYQLYAGIIDGNMPVATLYVDNQELYQRHLMYGSLSGWSAFEPISPNLLDNKYSVIYSSGNYRVLTSE